MSGEHTIQTSIERSLLSESLIQTEMTDAVNSGLVGHADKSASTLKEALYSKDSKGSVPKVYRVKKSAGKEGSSQEMDDSTPDETREGDAPQDASGMKLSLKAAMKYGVRGGVERGVHKTLEDSPLEGADEAYIGTRGAVRVGKRIARRLRGTDAMEKEASLGKLSEKSYQTKAKARTVQDIQRKAQSMRNLRKGVQSAQKARVMQQGIKTKLVTGKVSHFVAALGAALGPVLLGVFSFILLLVLLVNVLGGSENPSNNISGFGDLTGVELEVAQALANEGLGRAQIAAIMGNIVGESGFDPNCEYHGEGNNYAYEYGYGLYQFTDTSGGGDEYSRFVTWCNANGKSRSSAAAQTEFFIKHLRASWGTGLHRSGYYTKYLTAFSGRDASYDAWLATDDVDFATYCIMACWLRPADWAANQSFYRDRLPAAQAYYAKLSEGGGYGQDYAASNGTQRAIVNAAHRTASPGAGWCALWVSNVYANAGLGHIGGNACDMYDAYCHSTDRSKLQVGMLVAVRSSSSGTSAGARYGHIGIYIGDNKIIHNMGSIATWDLDKWISVYCKWSPAGWGFPSNVA